MTPDTPYENVTIVVVTYHSRSLVESLCVSLRPYPNIIIIDNASTDGTAGALRAGLPHATIIERSDNGGFGTANNEALKQVDTPFALLLNPDCDIQPKALDTLLDTLYAYPSAGIAAPQSMGKDGLPQKSYRPAFFVRAKKTAYRVPDAICSAQWLRGCCLLIRTQAFRQIGGFDERFFLFYEDDDLCLRMQKAGYECLLNPAASVLHIVGASSKANVKIRFRRSFHYARSRYMAIRTYSGDQAARKYLYKTLFASLPATLGYALLLQFRYAVRWMAWGTAAACCMCRSYRLPNSQPGSTATGPAAERIPH